MLLLLEVNYILRIRIGNIVLETNTIEVINNIIYFSDTTNGRCYHYKSIFTKDDNELLNTVLKTGCLDLSEGFTNMDKYWIC